MVDGVHFLAERVNPVALGRKAALSNLSDINAMGGTPRHVLVTLGLPPKTPVAWLDGLYRGIIKETRVAGGDIVRSPVLFITLAAYGEAPFRKNWRRSLLLRDAAEIGDIVAVSGVLGGSAGGLRLVLNSSGIVAPACSALVAAHDLPSPPLGLGRTLVKRGVRCGMDLSDGLAGDLAKICQASGVGAEIDVDALPIHPALLVAFPSEAVELALRGGEDYNLLVTVRPKVWRRLGRERLDLTAVGRIVEAPGVRFHGLAAVDLAGFDHFGAGE
jgi:thiamine-monophosphate kinase